MQDFKFNKDLYSKEALIKAAYVYIDDYYIHLDCDDNYYYVTLDLKDGEQCEQLNEKSFLNELLIQETRRRINDATYGIREMMYARALASTVIDDNDTEGQVENNSVDADGILVDWFDANE